MQNVQAGAGGITWWDLTHVLRETVGLQVETTTNTTALLSH